jgi:uncharacterized protein involved in exopolysaccharide biosynthesis
LGVTKHQVIGSGNFNMSRDISAINGESHERDFAQVVLALMRFAVAVRYRKTILLAVLLVGGLLGGLYYLTATRQFSATAELLIIRTTPTMLSTSIGNGGVRQGNQMPTFEDLCTSDKVVEGALKYLRPEDRIDLAGVPKASWARVLQGNLVARAKRKRNIIVITYRYCQLDLRRIRQILESKAAGQDCPYHQYNYHYPSTHFICSL